MFESELSNDSNSHHQETTEESITDEHENLIDEAIKNISRNLRKGDWTYLGRHPEVI